MTDTYTVEEVAEILKDVTGEECACNVNGNDEWLSFCCDFRETDCPRPYKNGCWEQWLRWKHKRGEVI